MNPVTGEKMIEINGGKYTLRFPWKALSEIEQRYGDKPNFFDAEVLATIASIGLREKHPEMTAENLMLLSPPLIPFARDIQKAIQWAYFGPDEKPGNEEALKKNARNVAGLFQRIVKLFNQG